MARWVAIVAAAGAAVSGMVRAQPLEAPATVCDGRTVRAIAVEGTRRVEPDDVRAAISLRRGEVCTDEAVQADARTLWALDLFEDVAIEAVREGEEVDLRITLVERPSLRH